MIFNFFKQIIGKSAQQAMWKQANYDQLTEIPNRSLFMDRLQNAINQAKRSNGKLALLYLDLDGFKLINDTHGHYAGDEVLRSVASRVKSCIRESDTIARLGGDEFTVLLGNFYDSDEITCIVEKIINTNKELIAYENESLSIGMSIGIAVFPEHADKMDKLIKAADQAMYLAKEKSGSSFIYANNE